MSAASVSAASVSAAEKRWRAALVLLSWVALSAPVRADEGAADDRAQALFDAAVRRMDEGDFEVACPMLHTSQALDPASGTALNLGYCHERRGSDARAYEAYEAARRLALVDHRPDRKAFADKKLAELRPRVALVRVVLTEPARAERFEIRIDDRVLTAAELDAELAVEPGEHAIVARVDGTVWFEHRVNVPAGGPPAVVNVVKVLAEPSREPGTRAVDGAAGVVVGAPAVVGPGAAGVPGLPPSPASRPPSSGHARRAVQIGAGIAGIVSVGIGATCAVLAFDRHDAAEQRCSGGRCTPEGVGLESDASAFAWGANVGIAFGLAALGVTTWLWLTSPGTARASAPAPAGLRF